MKRIGSRLLIFAVVFIACNDATFVPSEADVRERFGPFIPSSATSVGGTVYYNDIDAMIGWYCAAPARGSASGLGRTSGTGGWTLRSETAEERTYDRFIDRAISSYEVVKLRGAENGCVTMAWLQADGTTPEQFEQSTEARWARAGFWRQFERVSREVAQRVPSPAAASSTAPRSS